MAVKKSGLGKGLDSLIPSSSSKSSSRTVNTNKGEAETKIIEKIVEKPIEIKLKINEVEPNREQPRKAFDEDALLELADSIRQFGILQPLLVQKKGKYFEIIAGERRWRAAKMAGLKEIPVVIKEFNDQEIVEISLIENIQRENLNPIEEAIAYKRLMTEFSLKQDEIADRVSKSRTAVTNSMRLLKLDERVQQMVIDEMLSTGHARSLLSLEDAKADFITKITRFYVEFHKKQEGIDGCVINDPLAVGYFLNKDLCSGIDAYTTVETEGLCVGQSIVDEKGFWKKEANSHILTQVDSRRFMRQFMTTLFGSRGEGVLR